MTEDSKDSKQQDKADMPKGEGKSMDSKDKKIKELNKKIQDLEKETTKNKKKIADLEDDLVWKQSDFENYRKSVEKRMENEKKNIKAKVIKDYLPFFDSFDKAHELLEQLENKDDLQPAVLKFLGGIKSLYNSLNQTLQKQGIKRINALGKPFDYNYHEVMLKVEDASVDEDTVVQEVQKGWMLDGRVLRPAMVAVSKKPVKEEPKKKEGKKEQEKTKEGPSEEKNKSEREED